MNDTHGTALAVIDARTSTKLAVISSAARDVGALLPHPAITSDRNFNALPMWNEDASTWGECELVLVADRTTGATHHVFRGWRFEAMMRAGQPAPGTMLFAVPIGDGALLASGWRYAMLLIGDRGNAVVPGSALFSWAVKRTAEAPDPLTCALSRAHTALRDHGWERKGAGSARYAKLSRETATIHGMPQTRPTDGADGVGMAEWETDGGALAAASAPGQGSPLHGDETKTTGERRQGGAHGQS